MASKRSLADQILLKLQSGFPDIASGMPIDIDLTQRVKIVNGVSLPDNSVNGRFSDRCIAVVGYPDYGIDEGDILMFDKEYVQEYTLWGKDYFFIPPEFVHGKLEKIESK